MSQDELQYTIEGLVAAQRYIVKLECLQKRTRRGFELATLIAALMTILAIIGWIR